MTDQYRVFFEGIGTEQVRLLMQSGQMQAERRNEAIAWLAEQERDASQRTAASQAEMAAIASRAAVAAERAATAAEEAVSAAKEQAAAARRAAEAADRANKRATIALMIAAVSAIGTFIGVLLSHQDATTKPPIATQDTKSVAH